jgi:hypothetical protein
MRAHALHARRGPAARCGVGCVARLPPCVVATVPASALLQTFSLAAPAAAAACIRVRSTGCRLTGCSERPRCGRSVEPAAHVTCGPAACGGKSVFGLARPAAPSDVAQASNSAAPPLRSRAAQAAQGSRSVGWARARPAGLRCVAFPAAAAACRFGVCVRCAVAPPQRAGCASPRAAVAAPGWLAAGLPIASAIGPQTPRPAGEPGGTRQDSSFPRNASDAFLRAAAPLRPRRVCVAAQREGSRDQPLWRTRMPRRFPG